MANANNQTAIFNFSNSFCKSYPLRAEIDEHGAPWFCAKDVCDILGYANHNKSINDHCTSKGVTNRYPLKTEGGIQYPLFITEGNLYRLIIKSNKPESAKFESWVCDEVLPSIRKTGQYSQQQKLETETETPIEYFGYNRVPVKDSSGKGKIAPARPASVNNWLLEHMDRTAVLAATVRDEFMRQHYIQKLDLLYRMTGLTMPDISKIGVQTKRDHKVSREFFKNILHLERMGVRLNHSDNPNMLAISLLEYVVACGQHLNMPRQSTHTLKPYLKRNASYPYLSTDKVPSSITDKTVECWIFSNQYEF
jgi:prophage antirepressor-like protein